MTLTIKDPLSASSEVVSQRRRWTPDWYSWLSDLTQTVSGFTSWSPLTPQQFGALANGSNDDTAAIQGCVDAAISAGVPMFLPAGNYKISSTINVTNQIFIFGQGDKSEIRPASGITAITVNSSRIPIFRNFGVVYRSGVGSSGTSAISCTSGATDAGPMFQSLSIGDCFNGIVMDAEVGFVIDSCRITRPGNAGIIVKNTSDPDQGDSVICNCFIDGLGTGPIGILFESAGGLRVENNKVLSFDIALKVSWASGAVTSQLFVVGNSFDGTITASIKLTRQGSTGNLYQVTVVGNALDGGIGVHVPNDTNGSWLRDLNITGNSYFDTTTATSGLALADIDSTQGLVISNNIIRNLSSAGANVPITTRAGVDRGVVGPNIISAGTWAASSIGGTNMTTIAPT